MTGSQSNPDERDGRIWAPQRTVLAIVWESQLVLSGPLGDVLPRRLAVTICTHFSLNSAILRGVPTSPRPR